MALINSVYPPDSENRFLRWLSGVGTAILGTGTGKFRFGLDYFQHFNTKQALIDCSYGQLMIVAKNVPHLNVVLSRGAELFSNMEIRHKDKDGNIIENSPVMKLLYSPSPTKGLEDWLYEYYIMNGVYSNVFIYKNKGSKTNPLPMFLWNLPSGFIKINLTGKLYRQIDIAGIIENYELMGDPKPFEPSEILHIYEGLSTDGIKAASRIESLQIVLSNIVAALKSNNIILTERGLIGFIASDGSNEDSNGALPPSTEETKRMEKDYQRRRSLDGTQGHVTFTSSSIKWVPMTFDIGQLKLYEGLEDAFGVICGAYGLDRDLFPSTKGATNENKKQGLISTIQNTMQPMANKLMRRLSYDFGLLERGEYLEASYEWMPVMKSDELKQEQALKTKTEALSIQLHDGVISHDSYAESLEIEKTGDSVIKTKQPTSATNPPPDGN